jgi:hypothetical protein
MRKTSRFLFVSAVLAAGALAGAWAMPLAATDDPVVLNVTPMTRDGQLLVSFELDGGMTAEVRDAIKSGLPTSFSYDVELRRGTAIWFDRTVSSVAVTATVRFDNLTRRYQMSREVDGRVEDARPTEDEGAVRDWMTRFERIPLSATAALEANGEYYVRIRAHTRPRTNWFLWPWDRGSILGRSQFTFLP